MYNSKVKSYVLSFFYLTNVSVRYYCDFSQVNIFNLNQIG